MGGCRAGCIIDEAAGFIKNVLSSGGGGGLCLDGFIVSEVLCLLFRQHATARQWLPDNREGGAWLMKESKGNDAFRRCWVYQVVGGKLEGPLSITRAQGTR